VASKAGRRAAREQVSAYHQAQLAGLLSHVGAAIDRYRASEIDAHDVDETNHHYHRAAAELWKLCFTHSGGRPRRIHRRPPRPHDRRRGSHRLVSNRIAGTAVPAGTSPTYITAAPNGLWVVDFTAGDLLHLAPASTVK
jgi:hypothetical protein